jgi:hypothetical protein
MRRGVSRSGSGLECGAWGDPDDRGDARQAGFAGKTAVPIEPIDLPGARNGSLLDAAMAVVEIGGALKAIRIGIGKRGPISARRLVLTILTSAAVWHVCDAGVISQ